jgi:predicted metal-dependent peptidase
MHPSAFRILEELSRTSIELLLREPFYAHLLSSLSKVVVAAEHPVDTIAISMEKGALALYINADFWDRVLVQPAHRYGVLKHELLHLVFRHPFVYEPALDPLLLNAAFDLVVNQYIERAQLPDDSLFLDTFGALHLEAGQTWFYYYKKLEELRPHASNDSPTGKREAGAPLLHPDAYGLERHKPWKALHQRSELERYVAETHLKNLLQMACRRSGERAWGLLPGALREALENRSSAPIGAVSWRRALRLFAASAAQTRLKNTIRRPSKRYGTTPGLQVCRKQRLLVAIDTSASISQHELNLFFVEVHRLWRTGVAVEIVETDARVQRRYPYRGCAPSAVSGRGGTDFNDALQVANAERPDGLIFFTDGYAEAPTVRPCVPVLWVIAPDGIDATSPTWERLWGRRVKMRP